MRDLGIPDDEAAGGERSIYGPAQPASRGVSTQIRNIVLTACDSFAGPSVVDAHPVAATGTIRRFPVGRRPHAP